MRTHNDNGNERYPCNIRAKPLATAGSLKIRVRRAKKTTSVPLARNGLLNFPAWLLMRRRAQKKNPIRECVSSLANRVQTPRGKEGSNRAYIFLCGQWNFDETFEWLALATSGESVSGLQEITQTKPSKCPGGVTVGEWTIYIVTLWTKSSRNRQNWKCAQRTHKRIPRLSL